MDKTEKKESGDYQKMVSVPICHQQPRILWASYSQVFSDIVRSCKNGCMKQSHHKKELYDVEISPELVTEIAEKIMPEVTAWQNRPPEWEGLQPTPLL